MHRKFQSDQSRFSNVAKIRKNQEKSGKIRKSKETHLGGCEGVRGGSGRVDVINLVRRSKYDVSRQREYHGPVPWRPSSDFPKCEKISEKYRENTGKIQENLENRQSFFLEAF